VKGQKARTGVSIKGFEGGQTPIYRRLPKRGFNPLNPVHFETVNIGRLQSAIDKKKIDASQPIDEAVLKAAGLCSRKAGGVRLLGTGELKAKVTITVSGASGTAKAAVEKAGGSLTVLIAPKAEAEPKAEKKAKKVQVKEVIWKDDAVKRRSIKTRGDASGGLGWRSRNSSC